MSGQPTPPADSQRRPSPAELLSGLFRLSRPSVPAGQFYPAFLAALTTAVRGQGACLWRAQGDAFQVLAHRQVDQVGLRPETEGWAAHQQLLAGIVRGQKPVRFRPGEVAPAGTNPLNLELLCVPVAAGSGRFVIEVFSVPAQADSKQPKKGRLARLNQLCEFFRDYLQAQDLRQLAEQATVEAGLRAFVARLNAAVSTSELAVVAVNEGRQVIGGERVSLGWMIGRKARISVSGHDTIDARSNVIQALNRLTKTAARSGLTLLTNFSPEGPDVKLASGTGTAGGNPISSDVVRSAYQSDLDAYPAADRPRTLLVIPLADPSPGPVRGALLVEQFQSEGLSSSATQRAVFVAEQIRLSLRRLEVLESVPFLSWWSRSARGGWTRRIRSGLLAVIGIGVLTGLALLPMELRLPADGELLAETRHAVFAPENGVIREVHVEHGSRVRAGDPLLNLDNLELSAQLGELTGRLIQLRERQRSLEARRSGVRLTEREQIELQSSLVEVASSVGHTEHQIGLLQKRLDRLQVTAPADGVVTSWNVKQTLLNRTVLPGDALLQEIEPAGSWMIELRIPEDRVGYVTRHLSDLPPGEPLKVEFVLATEPEQRYPGRLRSIASRTELTADGHIVRAVIELDPEHQPPLRDGAGVKARLHCGTGSAGFVCFRELIEVIQTYFWY